jgi:hypothetical protein
LIDKETSMRAFGVCVLTIVFASLSSRTTAAAADNVQVAQADLEETAVFSWEHRLSGKILNLKGSTVEIETRDKRTVEVDAAPAIKSHRAYVLAVGGLITAFGSYDAKGVLHAKGISRAKRLPVAWPEDR